MSKPKVELAKLPVGARVNVKTRNSEYQFMKLPGGAFEGRGGWFKVPTLCYIHGCTFGGSMIMAGMLCEGMKLEASVPDRMGVLTTSTIQEVKTV